MRSPVSLHPLVEVVFGEILQCLVLFVEVAGVGGVVSVEVVLKHAAKVVLQLPLLYSLGLEDEPRSGVPSEGLGEEIGLRLEEGVQEYFELRGE